MISKKLRLPQRPAKMAARLTLKQLFDYLCLSVMQLIVQQSLSRLIAEVAGVATAAGCQLVASCDLALAADSARFATPGVNIGLFCSTPMVALSRNVVEQACHGDALDRRYDQCRES